VAAGSAKQSEKIAGVVIKEQLAPYIGGPRRRRQHLAFAARFDGKPVVTPTGNIAYVFPSLQVTSGPEQEPARENFLARRQGKVIW